MFEPTKIAAIQMESITGSKKQNISKAEHLIRKAAKENAKIICLPELFLTGYNLTSDEFHQLAEETNGPMAHYFSKLTAELGIFLVAPFPEKSNDGSTLYNSALLLDKGVIKGTHRKVYLWGDSEKQIFKPGDQFQTVTSSWGNVGVMICADAEYPEPPRILAIQGAEILLVPSVWSMQAKPRWDIFLPAAALSNLCYLAGVNTYGNGVRGGNCGNSKILDPYGQVICEASTDKEAVLTADIDLELVKKARTELPYFKDFRKDICIKEFSK